MKGAMKGAIKGAMKGAIGALAAFHLAIRVLLKIRQFELIKY